MTRSLYFWIAMLLMLTAPCLPLLGQNSPFGACSFVADSSGATVRFGCFHFLDLRRRRQLVLRGNGIDPGERSRHVFGIGEQHFYLAAGHGQIGAWIMELAGKCPDIAIPALLE